MIFRNERKFNSLMDQLTQLEQQLAVAQGAEKAPLLLRLAMLVHAQAPEQTRSHALEALTLAHRFQDVPAEAEAYKLLGIVEWSNGQYEDALYYARRSASLFEQTGQVEKAASAKNVLGVIYSGLGMYKLAINTFLQIFPIIEEVNNVLALAHVNNIIGLSYIYSGNLEKGRHYLQIAQAVAQDVDDTVLRIEILSSFGKLHLLHDEVELAIVKLQQALEIAHDQQESRPIAVVHDYLAEAYLRQQKLELAASHKSHALLMREKIGYFNSLVASNLPFARQYVMIGELTKAEALLIYMLDAAQKSDSLAGQMEVHRELAALYEKQGNYESAYKHATRRFELFETLQTAVESREMKEMRVKYEADQIEKDAEIYRLKNVEFAKQNKALAALNQEINEIMGIVAHDLRNPLTSLRLTTDIWQRELNQSLTEKEQQRLARMADNVHQMMTISNLLLFASKAEHGTIEVHWRAVPLRPLLAECVRQAEGAAEEKAIVLAMQIEGEPLVRADADLLTQVVNNLLSNAIKYSPVKTAVSLTVTQINSQIQIAVQDYGVGLTSLDMPKLFTKYGRLSGKPTANESSVGLGLFIAKKLVTLMNGQIHATSQGRDKGSTFYVLLPATENSPQINAD